MNDAVLPHSPGGQCPCTVGINNPDLQKPSETTGPQNAEEKKYLLGERTAPEKNRYMNALMLKNHTNSETVEGKTLEMDLVLSSQYSAQTQASQRLAKDVICDS